MEKRGLGRGLAALISDTMDDEQSGMVRDIPVTQIVPNPYQPRTVFDAEKLEELAASVKEHGILQPVLVRRVGHERYQLVAGERRFRAAQVAGLSSIPALVKEIAEKEQLEMAVVENVQREDIGVMEAARAYRRLIDEFGMTQETVAQRVGKSRSAVANTVRLLQLPDEVQLSVECGDLSEGHARALLTLEDRELRLRAWQTVVGKGLSVRETESLTRDWRENGFPAGRVVAPKQNLPTRPRSNGAGTGALDANTAAMADTLQQALGTKVVLRYTAAGAGKIEIEFYSEQELERLMELMVHGRYDV